MFVVCISVFVVCELCLCGCVKKNVFMEFIGFVSLCGDSFYELLDIYGFKCVVCVCLFWCGMCA